MLKRILPLLLVLVIMLAGCGKSDADTPNNTYEKITMSEGLARMESDENYILLDVRRADEFESGHIPGAVNLPNEEIGTEEIPSLPDKAQTIYIYCRSGNRSRQASAKLAAMGYKNIVEFGGIIDWPYDIE